MHIGAILPTINLWGGVKRFLELGNRFIAKGHQFRIFTPQGEAPQWFAYKGIVERMDAVANHCFDALFITEPAFLQQLAESRTRVKIFYHVLERESLKDVLTYPQITIFANSSNIYHHDQKKYGITPFKAFGGVTIPSCVPSFTRRSDSCFTVLTYGRLNMKRKGTRFVVSACERLYKKYKNIQLLLYDTPVDEASEKRIQQFTCNVPFEFIRNHPVEKNYELFRRADVFALAEKSAGWSNTCAEALAAGVPVIGTRSGTQDFLVHRVTGLVVWRNAFSVSRALETLMHNEPLRQRLAKSGHHIIQQFTWDMLADSIEHFIADR